MAKRQEGCGLDVAVSVVPGNEDIFPPTYMSARAAGMDLRAAVKSDLSLGAGERVLVGTGLRIAVPEGYEGQVRPRSGLAVDHGITVLNSPGTIDPDYRGEIKVILVNLGREALTVRRGDRIAQLVVGPVARVVWRESEDLPATQRGDGGFGHTGRE